MTSPTTATMVPTSSDPQQTRPAPISSCCAPQKQATCCEPEKKASCCGTERVGRQSSCGCQ